jgi:hypothetical protein
MCGPAAVEMRFIVVIAREDRKRLDPSQEEGFRANRFWVACRSIPPWTPIIL